MRLFTSNSQAATSPPVANSSSDEAGEIFENSHTRRSGSIGGKSRSLERYSGAPKIYPQTAEMLPPYATPTCSTRRRLLAPFRSMKRRSRSSSSSNESHHFSHHLSHLNNLNNLVVVNVGAATGSGGVAKAKAKASSQSGDSGTGGTELEHDMEQDDGEEEEDDDEDEDDEGGEMDELSLSYSQLSSSGCDEAEPPPEAPPEGASSTVAACVDERRRNMLSLYSSSSEEQLHCRLGDITLVDDTYSNYDPQNEAERMFLQVVGILRDENEVCASAKQTWSEILVT